MEDESRWTSAQPLLLVSSQKHTISTTDKLLFCFHVSHSPQVNETGAKYDVTVSPRRGKNKDQDRDLRMNTLLKARVKLP